MGEDVVGGLRPEIRTGLLVADVDASRISMLTRAELDAWKSFSYAEWLET